MLFGQQARGPLEVFRNQWIPSSGSPKSATVWLQENRELLANLRKIAEINQTKAKTVAKTRHDSTASDKCFEINDLVLVFSPVVTGKATEKLQDRWQGHYKVIGKVTPVPYLVERHKRQELYMSKQCDLGFLQCWPSTMSQNFQTKNLKETLHIIAPQADLQTP